MTSELQQNRYDQVVRRVGGLIGPGSKVSEVLSELFPTIDLENLPPELLLLGGTNPAFGAIAITGAAGERPRGQLFNPAGSGMLVTVTSVLATAAQPETFRWTVTPVALTTSVAVHRSRDTRIETTSRPVAETRQQSSVALTDAHGQVSIDTNTIFYLQDTNGIAILAPGSGFEIGLSGIASTLKVTFYWRERVAERSELNL